MKVFAALTFATLAGSAVAQPIARVHRRAVAHLNGTHYETKWKDAHQKYLDFKAKSETASAEAKRWKAISIANKEAFDAWGDKEYHKKQWDDHVGERAQLFKDFLVPKHKAYSKKQKEYNKAQLDLDALLTEYNANHTQRKVPINKGIADNKKGMETTAAAIAQYRDDIKDQTTKYNKYKKKFDAFTQDLKDENLDFKNYKAKIRAQKKKLSVDNGVWNQSHEVDWANRSLYWNNDRDTQEAALKKTHDSEFDEWLAEKLDADVSNGHCPCENGGTCAPGQTEVDDYKCVCASGYQGTNCETQIQTSHTVTFKTTDQINGVKDRIFIEGYGYVPKRCLVMYAECTLTFNTPTLILKHEGTWDGWYLKMKGDVGGIIRIQSNYQSSQRYTRSTKTTYGSEFGVDGDAANKVIEFAWA